MHCLYRVYEYRFVFDRGINKRKKHPINLTKIRLLVFIVFPYHGIHFKSILSVILGLLKSKILLEYNGNILLTPESLYHFDPFKLYYNHHLGFVGDLSQDTSCPLSNPLDTKYKNLQPLIISPSYLQACNSGFNQPTAEVG